MKKFIFSCLILIFAGINSLVYAGTTEDNLWKAYHMIDNDFSGNKVSTHTPFVPYHMINNGSSSNAPLMLLAEIELNISDISDIYYLRGLYYKKQDDFVKEQDNFIKGIQKNNFLVAYFYVNSYYNLAEIANQNSDYWNALKLSDKAIEVLNKNEIYIMKNGIQYPAKNSQLAQVLTLRSEIKLKLNSPEGALEDITQAIKLDGNNLDSLAPEMISDEQGLNQRLKPNDENTRKLIILGRIYDQKKDYQKAINYYVKSFGKIVDTDPRREFEAMLKRRGLSNALDSYPPFEPLSNLPINGKNLIAAKRLAWCYLYEKEYLNANMVYVSLNKFYTSHSYKFVRDNDFSKLEAEIKKIIQ